MIESSNGWCIGASVHYYDDMTLPPPFFPSSVTVATSTLLRLLVAALPGCPRRWLLWRWRHPASEGHSGQLRIQAMRRDLQPSAFTCLFEHTSLPGCCFPGILTSFSSLPLPKDDS